MEFVSNNTRPLSKDYLIKKAKELNVEPAALQAFKIVESGGRTGYLPDGRPQLLFESHSFHNETNGIYDDIYPNLSTDSWVKNYGASGAHQYERLLQAISLNREAALKSASWGAFQIMGFNYKNAGYKDVESFVADMVESEEHQFDAFITFITNINVLAAIRKKDWNTAARLYNGSGQVSYYSNSLQNAYTQAVKDGWGMTLTPDTNEDMKTTLKKIQVALKERLLYKGNIDGLWGPMTRKAIEDFVDIVS